MKTKPRLQMLPGAPPAHDEAAVDNMIERFANRLKADGSDPSA
jgi:hypothetical protein